jgi:spermidine/putrescine-binding protein
VKDAPNADLAYKWINFMTSKDYFTHWITKPGPNQQLAVPVNTGAVDALPKDAATKLSAGKLINYSGPAAFQAGVPLDRLQKWTQLWEEVKAG